MGVASIMRARTAPRERLWFPPSYAAQRLQSIQPKVSVSTGHPVLAEQATVLDAADDGDALVIPDAFGQPQAPAPVDTLVARVREALDSTPAPSLLLLDDTPPAAHPGHLRQHLERL